MQRTCPVCGEGFVASSPRAKFCGARCRKRASRHPEIAAEVSVAQVRVPVAQVEGLSIEAATLAELERVGRAVTVEGRKALLVARRLDSDRWESGMGLSAVMKEHSRLLADALAGAEQVADPVDELRARRDRKRAG